MEGARADRIVTTWRTRPKFLLRVSSPERLWQKSSRRFSSTTTLCIDGAVAMVLALVQMWFQPQLPSRR